MWFETMRAENVGRMQSSTTVGEDQRDAVGAASKLGNSTPGHVISNPISGEQIVILISGAETAGQLLVFDLFLPPGKHVPSWHTHPIQEERFTILAGRMRIRHGWQNKLASPGDTVMIPPGVAHWFGNAGPGVSHARIEVRPALRTEELFEATVTLDTETPHSLRESVQHLPAFARLLIEFQREVAAPYLAVWLVRPVLAVIARLDRHWAKANPGDAARARS